MGCGLFACISAATVEESMPPDRNMPSGTSATMRRRTASESNVSSISCAAASGTSSGEDWPRAATSDKRPIGRLLDLAAFAAFEQRPGRELVDPPIDAHRRRHIAVTQECSRARCGRSLLASRAGP